MFSKGDEWQRGLTLAGRRGEKVIILWIAGGQREKPLALGSGTCTAISAPEAAIDHPPICNRKYTRA